MEHILQFGVNIDDEKIAETAIKCATDALMKNMNEILKKYTNRWVGDSELDIMFRDEIKKILEENKDYIINESIKHLTANMVKTKAVRTAIDEVISEVSSND